MKRIGLALALVLFVAACAPKNYVVLLEDPEGGSGKVMVTTNEGRQVLDEPGTATAIDKTVEATLRAAASARAPVAGAAE